MARRGAGPAPLLMRREFPEGWRVVLAVPAGETGVFDEDEEASLSRLRPGTPGSVDAVAGIVLLQLLPALVERDLDSFGSALTEIQNRIGAWFAPVQVSIPEPIHEAGRESITSPSPNSNSR